MTPSTTELIVLALVKYGPALAKGVYDLFQKADPTKEDFDKLFAIAEKTYEDYVKPTAP